MKYKLELEITPEEQLELMRGSMQWPVAIAQQPVDFGLDYWLKAIQSYAITGAKPKDD